MSGCCKGKAVNLRASLPDSFKVSRAILKNKGLTPHRSKSVRNPRVKKRTRYKKAKKVASQKAVYKGGSGEAINYSGERSDISKFIKSTKLS